MLFKLDLGSPALSRELCSRLFEQRSAPPKQSLPPSLADSQHPPSYVSAKWVSDQPARNFCLRADMTMFCPASVIAPIKYQIHYLK